MTLLRVLHAELLKMKRTIALKLVVLFPASLALLILFAASQAPFSMFNLNAIRDKWLVLTLRTLIVWAPLMMPLFITLETALIAGLDHSENQWKSLLARPAPRWTFYVAKLLVAMAMTAASTLVLVCGILLDGAILSRIQSEVIFGSPVPLGAIFRVGAQIAGLSFLALTIQHWVSLRWRSFAVAIGVGIVAMIIGIFGVAAGREAGHWAQYFPWALPMLALARQPQNIGIVLSLGAAAGLAVAAAGCWDFCRREVT